MRLLEILMIEDFCNSIENKIYSNDKTKTPNSSFSLSSLLFTIVIFAIIHFFIVKNLVEEWYLFLMLSIGMTYLIPKLINRGLSDKKILILNIINILNGYISIVLLMNVIFGTTTPLSNLGNAFFNFLKTFNGFFIEVITIILGVVILVITSILDLIVIPLLTIPFLQRIIIKLLKNNKNK